MIRFQILVVCALLAWLSILAQHVAAQDSLMAVPDSMKLGKIGILEDLLGPAVKTVVSSSVEAITKASPIFCPVTTGSILNYSDEPQVFFYSDRQLPAKYVRITNQDEITMETVQQIQFDPSQMTYIIVHGCVGGIDKNMFMTAAKNIILGYDANGSCPNQSCPAAYKTPKSLRDFRPNVIVVDWNKYAGKHLYIANRNTLVVAERLARHLKRLVELGGLRPELMHCVGHSFGSHVCGQTGRFAFISENSSSRLGRITAFDAGGFCYNIGVENETTYTGLKPSDALLVDAFYTNRGIIGAAQNFAQYNVIVNDGVNQPACSLKGGEHPKPAYLTDSIGALMGNFADAQTGGCDHFFSTRFLHQRLPPICDYVSYACDSYRSFLRGRCAFCANLSQCYAVSLEYQRQDASIEHYADDVKTYSSYYNSFTSGQRPVEGKLFNGSVPLNQRREYYMRTSDYEPYCSISYRVRVQLSEGADRFPVSELKLQFIDAQGQIMRVICAATSSPVIELELFGPWLGNASYGLDERTYTSLFDLDLAAAKSLLSITSIDQVQGSPIKQVVAIFNHDSLQFLPSGNPIRRIALDYIGSSNQLVREKLSLWFDQGHFSVINK